MSYSFLWVFLSTSVTLAPMRSEVLVGTLSSYCLLMHPVIDAHAHAVRGLRRRLPFVLVVRAEGPSGAHAVALAPGSTDWYSSSPHLVS